MRKEIIVEEGRNIGGAAGLCASGADRIGFGKGRRYGTGAMAVQVVVGEVACKISNDGVERLGSEELKGVLPLVRTYQLRVGNDLYSERFKRLLEFGEPLPLPSRHEAMELFGRVCMVGDFVDVVVEGFGVLEGVGKGVVLIVERGEKVVSLHAKLPGGPR